MEMFFARIKLFTFVKDFLREKKNAYSGIKLETIVTFVTPLFISICILISMQGTFQVLTIGQIFGAQKESQFKSYYEYFLQFPDIINWLYAALDVVFISQALMMTLIFVAQKSIFGAFKKLSIYNFFIFSVFDIYNFAYENYSSVDKFVCIMANALGGILVSAIIAFLAITYNRISLMGLFNGRMNKLLSAVSIVSIAILLNTLAYILMVNVFGASISKIEFLVNSPSQGFYSKENGESKEELDKDTLFPIPSEFSSAKFEFLSSSQGAQFIFRQDKLRSYQILISALFDCVDYNKGYQQHIKNFDDISNFKEFKVDLSNGYQILEIKNFAAEDFKVKNPTKGFFWINQKKGSLSFDVFQRNGYDLQWSFKKDFRIFIVAPLLSSKNEKLLHPLDRSISFYLNGSLMNGFRAHPADNILKDQKLSCSSTKLSKVQDKLPGNKFHTIGLIIDVLSNKTFPEYSPPLTVNAHLGEGQLSLGNVGPKDIKVQDIGGFRNISISGGMSDVNVDDNQVRANKFSQINTLGEYRAELMPDSTIKVYGKSDSIWIDGGQVNRSKWSKLKTEFQILILTTILGFFAFCVGKFHYLRSQLCDESFAFWRI